MIELINLSKCYESKTNHFQALNNISLTINKSEIFGVIGKSGAGKSTLIRCMNLLEKPTQGTIKIDGDNLTNLSPNALRRARRKIGMIFQHFHLLAERTVYQNVALPLELMGESQKQIEEKVMPLLDLTELVAKKMSYPSALSGGQKQRVAIARALVAKPSVLLCDEATSALDLHTTESILQLLKNINQTFGLTIVLITHEVEVVKKICDRVALLHEGKVVEEASVFDFFTDPKSSVAQALVKSSLGQELPEALQKQLYATSSLHGLAVLRLIFHGKAAAEPLVANLAQRFGIKLNILQANIEFLKNDALGIMVVEVMENAPNLSEGIAYLKSHHVNVEVIGYVNRHAT